MELKHGLDCLRAATTRVKNLHPTIAETLAVAQPLLTRRIDVYAACFCETDDLLTQWHGYGNRGGGYSIGLSAPELPGILAGREILPGKVEYDLVISISRLEDELRAGNEAVLEVLEHPLTDEQQRSELLSFAGFQVFSSLAITMSFMKDASFQGEQEWRLVQYRSSATPPQDDLQFRVTGDVLVPYIPVSLQYPQTGVLPLSSVTLGPTAPASEPCQSVS